MPWNVGTFSNSALDLLLAPPRWLRARKPRCCLRFQHRNPLSAKTWNPPSLGSKRSIVSSPKRCVGATITATGTGIGTAVTGAGATTVGTTVIGDIATGTVTIGEIFGRSIQVLV
jgi:hypothetical protein